ncbi:hypothetical protein CAOG_05705 [Capsaspora owczarzaki ATCC 30864]|uniref:Uncharacterized protein n=1 Tax=Capsaspora owczarzaki (strain ATCC 30864) TaxID=595528 RepID=A0A0D2WTY8_CAPO3|nr:hypothetical protein CAOG_05705 [Capsaspora owczarzaki ATCC 30864]KJE95228.1 hypothetical protein CAOG_005705 [Capsaspora owczarzaki ATCC 30864]|eukprot:XP_004346378.1 hypothetical protein CAOG_05705 [Capsaspora owczarzaki ATCC 30864]
MTGALQGFFVGTLDADNGSVADPSIQFTEGNGFFLPADNEVAVAIDGVEVATFSDTGLGIAGDLAATNVEVSGAVVLGAGSATVPSISFSGDSNTGIYAAATDILGFAAGGAAVATISSSGIGVAGNVSANSMSTASLTMGGNKIQSLGTPTATDDAATKGYVDSAVAGGSYLPLAGGTLTGALLVPDGSASTPAIALASDTDTGIYSDLGALCVSAGGTMCAFFNALGIRTGLDVAAQGSVTGARVYATTQFLAGNGNVTNPAYSFSANSFVGLYSAGTNQLGVSANSTNVATFTTTALNVATGLNVTGFTSLGTGNTGLKMAVFIGTTAAGSGGTVAQNITIDRNKIVSMTGTIFASNSKTVAFNTGSGQYYVYADVSGASSPWVLTVTNGASATSAYSVPFSILITYVA